MIRSAQAPGKPAVDQKLSEPCSYPGIFAFELDFGGTLRCIPMSVRMKLDQVGVKLSLKQWSKLPPAERRQLVETPCENSVQITLYKNYVVSAIETFSGSIAEHLPPASSPPWVEVAQLPERIRAWAVAVAVTPPTSEQWSTLSALQRFALFKLTRPGHSNDNFIPAMREFNLLT